MSSVYFSFRTIPPLFTRINDMPCVHQVEGWHGKWGRVNQGPCFHRPVQSQCLPVLTSMVVFTSHRLSASYVLSSTVFFWASQHIQHQDDVIITPFVTSPTFWQRHSSVAVTNKSVRLLKDLGYSLWTTFVSRTLAKIGRGRSRFFSYGDPDFRASKLLPEGATHNIWHAVISWNWRHSAQIYMVHSSEIWFGAASAKHENAK